MDLMIVFTTVVLIKLINDCVNAGCVNPVDHQAVDGINDCICKVCVKPVDHQAVDWINDCYNWINTNFVNTIRLYLKSFC